MENIKINYKLLWVYLAIAYYMMPIAIQYIRSIGIILIMACFFICNYKTINKRTSTFVIFAIIWLLFSALYMFLLDYGLSKIFQELLSFVLCIFPTILYFSTDEYSDDEKKKIRIAVIIAVLVGAINTYIVLMAFPYASRLLASGTAENSIYGKMGAGGFGFIYSLVFIIPVLIRMAVNNKKYRGVLFAAATILFFVVIKASYTIAVLLMVFLAICGFFVKKWHGALFVLVLLGVVLFVNNSIIGDIFLNVSSWFPSGSTLNLKFIQLAEGILNNDLYSGTGGRIELYESTFEVIKASPIFGALKTGIVGEGHTSWLDLFAQYGVFSLQFFWLIRLQQKKTIDNLKNRSFVSFLYLTWFLLGFLNPIHGQAAIAFAVYFVVPLFEGIIAEKPKLSENINY